LGVSIMGFARRLFGAVDKFYLIDAKMQDAAA
jgi:hypothetical protein